LSSEKLDKYTILWDTGDALPEWFGMLDHKQIVEFIPKKEVSE